MGTVPVSKLPPAQRAKLVAAREAELDMMRKYGVFQSVDPSKYDLRRLRPLRLKFIYEYKILQSNGVRRVGIKARLVAQGMKRLDKRENVDVTTGMPKTRALFMLFAWVVSHPNYTRN